MQPTMPHNEERIAVMETRVKQLENEVDDIKKRLRSLEITIWKGVGIVSAMIWLSKLVKLPI